MMFKEKNKKGEVREIAPWRQLGGPDRIEREFFRMMREFGREPFFSLGWPEEPRLREGDIKLQIPAIEIYDEENDIVVKAELPGMKKEDLEISLSGDILTIKGEKKKEKEIKEKGTYYSERSYGAFERSIDIPEEVSPGKIRASFEEGVLEVRLQKSEEAKRREIKIKVQ